MMKLKDPYDKYRENVSSVCLFTRVKGLRVTWEISDHCNIGCQHCCRAIKDSENVMRSPLTEEQIEKTVKTLKTLNVVAVYLSGGEPTLNPLLYTHILPALRREGIYVSLATNATLIPQKPEIINYLRGTEKITVSLDHYEASKHDALRKPGSWKRTVEGIKMLKEAGFYVRVSTIIWRQMCHRQHLENMVEFLNNLGVDEVYFAWIIRVGNAAHNNNILPTLPKAIVTRVLEGLRDYYEDRIKVLFPAFKPLPHNTEGCKGGCSFLYISPHGDVWPCSWVAKIPEFSNMRQNTEKGVVKVWEIKDKNDLAQHMRWFRQFIEDSERQVGPFCPALSYTTYGVLAHRDERVR